MAMQQTGRRPSAAAAAAAAAPAAAPEDGIPGASGAPSAEQPGAGLECPVCLTLVPAGADIHVFRHAHTDLGACWPACLSQGQCLAVPGMLPHASPSRSDTPTVLDAAAAATRFARTALRSWYFSRARARCAGRR